MIARTLTLNSTNVRYGLTVVRERVALALAAAFAPERAVERAARLFATPPRHPHTPREIGLLRGGRGFLVNVGLRRLAAWRFGDPASPAVVFSHGWGGRGGQFRHFVAPFVEAGYQVVVFDHEGHGHSEGTEATLLHFARATEAVVAQLEGEGVAIAGLVGHSLGAAALGAYLNASGREIRAVLIAPPISIERYSGYFARRLGLSERLRRAMQESWERRLGRRWQEFELPQSVANVAAPALVIHDADDADVPFAAGAALARAWKGAALVRTHGLGHRGVLREAAVVRDALDFIAGRVRFPAPPREGERSPYGEPAPIA